jgi:hypothetical protein
VPAEIGRPDLPSSRELIKIAVVEDPAEAAAATAAARRLVDRFGWDLVVYERRLAGWRAG